MDFLETIYHFPEIVGIFGGLCVLPCGRDPSNVVFSRKHDPFNKSLRDHHEPRPHEVVFFLTLRSKCSNNQHSVFRFGGQQLMMAGTMLMTSWASHLCLSGVLVRIVEMTSD